MEPSGSSRSHRSSSTARICRWRPTRCSASASRGTIAERLPGPVVTTPVVRGGLSTHHTRVRRLGDGGPRTRIASSSSRRSRASSEWESRRSRSSAHTEATSRFVRDLVAEYDGRATLAGYSDLGRFLEVMMAAAAEHGLQRARDRRARRRARDEHDARRLCRHGPPLRRGRGLHGGRAGLADADLRGGYPPGQRERRPRWRGGRERARSVPRCSPRSQTSCRRTSPASSASEALALELGSMNAITALAGRSL